MENSTTLQWWIQDFPDGGANLWVWRKNLLFGKISAENCMKMKEIGSANVMELLPPANEVAGRQCFYMCLSVHRKGGAPFHIPHPPRDHAPPWDHTSPWHHTPGTTKAGGTHLTGMLSCWHICQLCVSIWEWLNKNSVNSLNSGNVLNHWSMDLVYYMCLNGCTATSLSLTQEAAGPNHLFLQIFCHWIEWTHLRKTSRCISFLICD